MQKEISEKTNKKDEEDMEKKQKKKKVKFDLHALENFLCPNCKAQQEFQELFCSSCGYNTWTREFHSVEERKKLRKILGK